MVTSASGAPPEPILIYSSSTVVSWEFACNAFFTGCVLNVQREETHDACKKILRTGNSFCDCENASTAGCWRCAADLGEILTQIAPCRKLKLRGAPALQRSSFIPLKNAYEHITGCPLS